VNAKYFIRVTSCSTLVSDKSISLTSGWVATACYDTNSVIYTQHLSLITSVTAVHVNS